MKDADQRATVDAPLVSVILPVFNRTDELTRALASVMAQSLADWELLVVDDGSDVDVEGVVARCHDARVRYVRRPQNGGVSAAQNTGLDHARGQFVVFLHSDDELFPDKLERQTQRIAATPASVGAVESGVEVEWSDRVEHWPPNLDAAKPFDLLAYGRRVHSSGLLVRRDLATTLRFDERLRGVEDRDFCIRLLRVAEVSTSSEVLSRVSKTGARLGSQNKAFIYQYLLEKYNAEIATDRRVHSDWHYRIARSHARAGEVPQARRALGRAIRLNPARARRWWLWFASYGGERLCRASFGTQVRAARRIDRSTRLKS
jgi:glycosyltransferase involved in cell wall biosynthesis